MRFDFSLMKIRYSFLYILLIKNLYNRALASQNEALASQKTKGS